MAALPLLVIVLAKGQGAAEAQIGLVFSASGAGGLLGALAGGWFARRFSFGQVIVGTLAVQAAMLPLLAWAPGPLTLGAAFAVLMFCGPVYNVVQLSRRLAMIPDGLQGRVNSAFRFAANVLYPVGAGAVRMAAGTHWQRAHGGLLRQRVRAAGGWRRGWTRWCGTPAAPTPATTGHRAEPVASGAASTAMGVCRRGRQRIMPAHHAPAQRPPAPPAPPAAARLCAADGRRGGRRGAGAQRHRGFRRTLAAAGR
jgi:MFS family permease